MEIDCGVNVKPHSLHRREEWDTSRGYQGDSMAFTLQWVRTFVGLETKNGKLESPHISPFMTRGFTTVVATKLFHGVGHFVGLSSESPHMPVVGEVGPSH